MIPEIRRNQILDYISSKKTVTLREISDKFKISEVTARRDFNILSNQKSLKKVYGGVTIIDTDISEPILSKRLEENVEEKKRIASEAIKRISDGDIILIEAGTTCLELLKLLPLKKNLKVITAAPHILNALIDLNRKDLFDGDILCSGGFWQKDPDDFFAGPQALRFYEGLKIDIAFFGIFAIDFNDGWMSPNMFEVDLTLKIINNSKKVIGITDHSKFNKTGFSRIGPITLFDEIITDSVIKKEELNNYRKIIKITTV